MARIPICMHKGCNAIGTRKIDIAKRGGRFGYLCDFHAFMLEGYCDENSYRAGQRKVNGFTFSSELETSYSDEKARGELLDFGFIATSDSTDGGESSKSRRPLWTRFERTLGEAY